jgi:hypothetical protein
LVPNDFLLFSKIKSAERNRDFRILKTFKKMWWWHWKLFYNRGSKNGSIVGLLKESILKVTAISNL